MTKCIVLGEAKSEEPKKKIEFKKCIYITPNVIELHQAALPMGYKNIELISKAGYGYHQDLMFAYDDDRNKGYLYLGYWNDGIV